MIDKAIVLLVVLVSANTAVIAIGKELTYLATLGILGLVAVFRREWPTWRDLVVLAIFGAILNLQYMEFGGDMLTAGAGFMVRLAIALLAARVVKELLRNFASVMVGLALLSFVFYVPSLLGLDVKDLLAPLRIATGNDQFNIVIHNFHTPEFATRNCGMFGEPGMFAGFIAVAMAALTCELDAAGWRRWLVLAAAMLSTTSTAGYVALVPLVTARAVAHQYARHGFPGFRIVPILAVLGGASALAYVSVPFLGEKIEHQLGKTLEGTDESRITRFGNFAYDVKHVLQRPFFGWSPQPRTRAILDAEVTDLAAAQGNGLSGFAVKFGLVGLAVYLIATLLMWRQYFGRLSLALAVLVVVVVVLSAEQFLNAPAFLTLMFAPHATRAFARTDLRTDLDERPADEWGDADVDERTDG